MLRLLLRSTRSWKQHEHCINRTGQANNRYFHSFLCVALYLLSMYKCVCIVGGGGFAEMEITWFIFVRPRLRWALLCTAAFVAIFPSDIVNWYVCYVGTRTRDCNTTIVTPPHARKYV